MRMTENVRKEISRWTIYLAADQLLALDIILNTRTGLGVAAFSSIFYAMAKIAGFTLGTCSMMLCVVLIAIQIFLLKKVTLQIVCEIPSRFSSSCLPASATQSSLSSRSRCLKPTSFSQSHSSARRSVSTSP